MTGQACHRLLLHVRPQPVTCCMDGAFIGCIFHPGRWLSSKGGLLTGLRGQTSTSRDLTGISEAQVSLAVTAGLAPSLAHPGASCREPLPGAAQSPPESRIQSHKAQRGPTSRGPFWASHITWARTLIVPCHRGAGRFIYLLF